MRRLVVQGVLALVWASLWESFQVVQLIGGFLIAGLVSDGFAHAVRGRAQLVADAPTDAVRKG